MASNRDPNQFQNRTVCCFKDVPSLIFFYKDSSTTTELSAKFAEWPLSHNIVPNLVAAGQTVWASVGSEKFQGPWAPAALGQGHI